jgi:GntR family transcriptional regulator
VALETTEVVAESTPDLLRKADFGRMSLYAVLQAQFGLRPATAEQTLAAAAADEAVAIPLGIAIGAPVLRLTRLTRDASGRPFEHVRSYYRGDAFVMKVRLELGEG